MGSNATRNSVAHRALLVNPGHDLSKSSMGRQRKSGPDCEGSVLDH
jgi:hypothetical protein